MRKQDEISANYKFAISNGYAGSLKSYMESNYAAYAAICKCCEIKPMDFTQWVNS